MKEQTTPLDHSERERLLARIKALEEQLELRRQQEEQLRVLLEYSSDALVVIDANGCQRYVSPGAQQITGFPVAELEGRTIDTLIHPDDLDRVQTAWNEVLQHPGRIVTVQYRHIHKTREWVHSEAIAKNCLGVPSVNGVIATVRDISQQKQAEEVLRQYQQTIDALLNVITESIHLLDREGRVLFANETTAQRLGTTAEELIGSCVYDFFPAEVALRRKRHLEEIISSGRSQSLTDERQGRIFQSNLWPIKDRDGQTLRVAIFSQDITGRMQTEQALRQNQTLLNATQRLAKVGGWEWNLTEQTMTWTEETFRIHGLTPDDRPALSAELIDRSLSCYRKEDRPTIQTAFHRCVEQGEPYDLQFPFRNADGKDLWIRTMAEPVVEDGRVILVRGNIMDLTREKRLERLLAARLRLSEMPSSLSLEHLLTSVMDEAENLTGSTIGFFHFVNQDQQTLTLQAWSRSTTTHFCQAEGKGLHYPVAEAGVWVDCLHQRTAVIHNDYASLPHRKGLPPGHAPVIRELVVPVFRDEKIVAIFGVGNKAQDYDQDDIEMITALGNLVWDIILRRRAEEELSLSEARFRTLLNNLPTVAIQGYRPDGIVHYWNQASEQLYGHTAEEAIGRNLLELIIPTEMRPEVRRAIAVMAESGQPVEPGELTLMRHDGSGVPVLSSHLVLTDQDGVPELFCVDIDLTESKRAAERLRLSEEQFRLSFERSPAGMAMMSPAFRFVRANDAFCRMIGYSEAELTALTFTDITHPDERQRDLYQAQRLLTGEIDRCDVEKRYLHKNGDIVWARVSAALVHDGENTPLYFLSIIQDITAWKKAEQALHESESRYQRIVETAREGIWIMNDQRHTTYVNEHMAAMLGLPPADIIGRPVEDFMFSEDLIDHEERMAVRRQGQGGHYEHRFRHRDGHAVWTIVSATPLKDDEGRFAGSFAMFTNITDRKQAEQQVRQQADFTRRVLDSAAAQIAILDRDGVIIDVNTPWNRFAEDNNGTAPEKLGPGTSYFCPWSPEHGDTTNAAPAFEGIRQVQHGEREDFQIEYPCHSPSENRWFTMRVLPLDGAPGQVLVSHTDITALKESEEHLIAALAEKDVLLREVHHRVKNNLAAIIGLLDMQRRLLEDAQGRDILTELGGRIRSMSLIHEKLYRSDNLARIDFQEYLQSLVSHLRTSFGSPLIHCQTEADGVQLPLDLAVPCGMIVNELVTNALKHAFLKGRPAPGRDACRIRVSMHQEDGVCTLCVADNGVGLPPGYDWTSAKTLGMVLVRMLGRHQLGGSYVLDQREGCSLTLTFNEQRGKK